MTENYKRIVKNTLFLYFRMFLIMGVSFYTVRVILDTLGVVDYGLYNLVAGFVLIIAFLNNTLTSGTQRFLTFELGKNDFDKLKLTFSISIIIHILLALFILLLAETVGLWFLYEKMNIPLDRFDAAFWVYQFAIFSTLISVVQVPYNALIIAHERMHIFAYISIVEVILKLLIVYLLLISEYDKLVTYAILMFLVSVFIAIIYRTYVVRNYQESHFKLAFDKETVKSMMNFSTWSIFGALAGVSSNHGINIILNIFFGPIVVAARTISMQVSSGLIQLMNSFQQAVTPQITKLYASNQIEEMNKLLYQNSKYAFLLLWFLTLPIFVQLDYVLNLWLIDVPNDTLVFTKLIMIHALLYSILKPFNMGIHAVGRMKMINLTSGISILMVLPISYILLLYGYPNYTVIIVYIFFTFLQFFFQIYYLKKYIGTSFIKIAKDVISPISLVVFISYLFSQILYSFINKINFIVFLSNSILISLFIIIISYLVTLNKQEKLKIKKLIYKKIGLI